MSNQFVIGVGALFVVVLGFLFLGGSEEDEMTIVQMTGDPATRGGTDDAGVEDLGSGRPGSLNLGGQPTGPGGANVEDGGKADPLRRGSDDPQGRKSSTFDGTAGQDDLDGKAQAERPDVRSRIGDVAGLAGTTQEAVRRGGGSAAARAPIDDWPEDAVDVVEPVEQRDADPGEILTLFEGDPAVSQAEATIENEVTIDEDGAVFNSESEYAVPMAGRMSGDAGTISFWVRPDGETSDIDNASLVQLRSANEWANRLQIWKDGSNIRLVFSDGGGVESGASYGSDGWAPDEWRLVTATWGEGMTALYVNGQLAGTSQYETPFNILPKTMLHVASNYRDDPRSLTGAVNQFRVYNRALNPDEIASLSSLYPE